MTLPSAHLSSEQIAAVDKAASWLKAPGSKQVFKLFGYAGTGKTTIARHLAGGLDGEVIYAAFTGKAALMMEKNGCKDARTIHRLIYRPERQENGAARFKLDPDSPAATAALIVIDECSMVNEKIAKDLLSFGRPVLVLGDPAQLPPPNGEGWFIKGKPDMLLTAIHRQALDNPLLRLATAARNHEPLRLGDYGTSRVISLRDLGVTDLLGADQVLVGTNNRVSIINQEIREALNRPSPLPCPGDRLVCLRNDYNKEIVNGEIFEVRSSMPARVTKEVQSMTVSSLDFPEWPELMVRAPVGCFPDRFSAKQTEVPLSLQHFDFGYALTVHKAQGSQWQDVLIYDESDAFGKERFRWIYTALTRAKERVTLAC